MIDTVIIKTCKNCRITSDRISRTVKKYLKKKNMSDASLEIEVVGVNRMTSLNRKYMKKSGPTDVLSFPLPKISALDNFLGTIVLCHDIIKSNSTKNGVSFKDKFDSNLKHGIDHLLGIHHD